MMKFYNSTFTKKIIATIPLIILCCFFHVNLFSQKIIGTTTGGGAQGWGTVFEMDVAASTYSKLTEFTIGFAVQPFSGVIEASDGNLYGITYGVGSGNGEGTVFTVAPDGSNLTILKTFYSSVPTDGYYPLGTLIEHSNGDLYGMTSTGGANNFGMIFKIKKDGTGFQILHSFGVTPTGGVNPVSTLIEDPIGTGELYGVAPYGFAGAKGAVFTIAADGSNFSTLKEFSNTLDGENPFGNLLIGSDGFLYGMTRFGGSDGFGTIFQISTDGSTFNVIHNFDGTQGSSPIGSLVEISNTFFGLTWDGGASNLGVLFNCNMDGSNYTVMHNFDGTGTGANPAGTLMQASDGLIYGVARNGGISNSGVMFSIEETGNFTKIHDFSTSTGSYPYSVQLIELTVPLPVELSAFRVDIVGNEVNLNWETQSESNNKGFTIQKSVDGIHWKNVDFVDGKGNTQQAQSYFYQDKNPFDGVNYYRLEQMDYDGKTEFSEIKVAHIKESSSVTLTPNPAINGQTDLKIILENTKTGHLKIMDTKGQILKNEIIDFAKGVNHFQLDTSSFSKGIYFIQIELGEILEVKKLVVE